MRPLFVLCFIVVFLVHDGQGSIVSFFSQIGKAFSVTWGSIVDAIKRPVRNKRIGPGPKRKALRAMTTHLPYIWSSPKDSEKFLSDISRDTANNIKVTLPLLLHPKYKAISEWINSENEKNSTTEQSSSNSSFIFPTAPVTEDDEQIDNKDSYIFGPLVFI